MASQTKKKGGSLLARKANEVRTKTEEELMKLDSIRPDDVLGLKMATKDYLCSPEANKYEIEFTRFKLRDLDSGHVLFEVTKPTGVELNQNVADEDAASNGRFVRYQFSKSFLQLKNVGATIEFTAGDLEITKFRMIERHYFRNRLLKSFDFDFGFVIPHSTNTVEHIYEFPVLTDSEVQEMIDNPYETKSDSFYFVNDRLVMHNKADYSYSA
uniref:GMP_PDE_delta domain-containing protein n=1 Tax=Macrostomum lignano TaxID=282301 RepID=A0A1I8GV45_9PLAT